MNELETRVAIYDSMVAPYIGFNPKEYLTANGFFTAPASTKYHGAYDGGLFDHSMNVMIKLCGLTDKLDLKWERVQSPYIIGFFHDLCKIDNYIGANGLYTYNDKTLYKGHGDKSVLLLSSLTCLTDEEVACITYHMGSFTDKEKWSDYTEAIHKYPNVLYTHMADMMAAHITEVTEVSAA